MIESARRRVLFVCTANMCRSPAAELLARGHPDGGNFQFRSAGLMRSGRPCTENMVSTLATIGVDARQHLSYRIDEASIEAAELILTMESGHIQQITDVAGAAYDKSVPLRQAADLLRQRPTEQRSIESFLEEVGREPNRRSRFDAKWDVADPYGGRKRAYRRAVGEIEGFVRLVVERLV